jgi:hypothetical protein
MNRQAGRAPDDLAREEVHDDTQVEPRLPTCV